MIFEGARFDLDSKVGVFGWLNASESFKAIFLVGFVCSFLSNLAYGLSLLYVEPVVTQQAMILEGVLATVFGVVTRADGLPGLVTVFAIILLVVASVLINKGSQTMFKQGMRGKKEEAVAPVVVEEHDE